jgi:hypothetical protein
VGFFQHIKAMILLENGGQRNTQEENEKKIKDLQKNFLLCGLVGVWAIKPNFLFSICNMKFFQHIKEIFFVENSGQRYSQKENEKKKLRFHKKFPALWTRASESGHLVQIFDSVSVIWGLFSIFK